MNYSDNSYTNHPNKRQLIENSLHDKIEYGVCITQPWSV